jgi:phospholipid transport system substrate-binding protein
MSVFRVARSTAAILVTAALALCAAAPAVASPDAARQFLENYSARAIDALSDADKPEDVRKAEFRSLLEEGFALRDIGRFVLGRYARSAEEREFEQFLDAFTSVLAQRYAPLFEGASADQVAIGDARRVEGRDNLFLVDTSVRMDDGKTSKVTWRVRQADNRFEVVDVVAEGVSMAITLRDEYGTVLGRGGLDRLTDRLEQVASRPQ